MDAAEAAAGQQVEARWTTAEQAAAPEMQRAVDAGLAEGGPSAARRPDLVQATYRSATQEPLRALRVVFLLRLSKADSTSAAEHAAEAGVKLALSLVPEGAFVPMEVLVVAVREGGDIGVVVDAVLAALPHSCACVVTAANRLTRVGTTFDAKVDAVSGRGAYLGFLQLGGDAFTMRRGGAKYQYIHWVNVQQAEASEHSTVRLSLGEGAVDCPTALARARVEAGEAAAWGQAGGGQSRVSAAPVQCRRTMRPADEAKVAAAAEAGRTAGRDAKSDLEQRLFDEFDDAFWVERTEKEEGGGEDEEEEDEHE